MPSLPNHVLGAPAGPLRRFSDVRGGGVVRTDHHNAGERSGSTQQYDPKIQLASVGGLVAAK
jgi:hypothetical protein